MEEAISEVIKQQPELIIPILIFVIGGLIAVIAIVFGTINSTTKTKEQERTRREIAAYIAEGSMTPEDGERLLAAGTAEGKKKRKSCNA